MRPRRDVFAVAYIEETVRMFKSVKQDDFHKVNSADLISWSQDVLTEYFDIAGAHPKIESAKSIFSSVSTHVTPTGKATASESVEAKKPYLRNLEDHACVSIDQLEKLAWLRRSCRWFLAKPVPRDLIDRALAVACMAPSACNRQPFEFRIFDDPDLVKQVASIPGGTSGFYHNFPCVAAIVGDMSAFPFDRDRHVPYIDASLAAMGFQFALEVQGISSCCINWPDVKGKERAVGKQLGLAADQRVIMMMAIGYPDPTGQVPYSQKKSLDELRSYNQTTNQDR